MHPDIAPGGGICECVFMYVVWDGLWLVLVKETWEQGEMVLDIFLRLHWGTSVGISTEKLIIFNENV